MPETTVFTYQISLSPTEWNQASAARRAAGDLWTRLGKIHRFGRRRHWRWPTKSPFKAHFKRRVPLHSQTAHAIIGKFCARLTGCGQNASKGITARGPQLMSPPPPFFG